MISSVLAGDVRQTLEQFQRSVDQMFQNFYGLPSETGRTASSGTGSEWRFSPAVESAWTDTSLTLRVILPGVSQNDVKVSVQNNQLIIEGERKAPEAFHKNGPIACVSLNLLVVYQRLNHCRASFQYCVETRLPKHYHSYK